MTDGLVHLCKIMFCQIHNNYFWCYLCMCAATKTALNMFQHDKTASMREKDLLRIMKVCLHSTVLDQGEWFYMYIMLTIIWLDFMD